MELLVVIAIIGLLSSIILSSLNRARLQAKDAAIKESVGQLANLFNLNYNETESYGEFMVQHWVSQQETCSSIGFTGNFAAQAKDVCADIFTNASNFAAPGGDFKIWFGVSGDPTKQYSVMVALNNGMWYCSGSSGRKGEYGTYVGQPGCFDNP